MTDKAESQFAQLQAIAKDLVALKVYDDVEITELQRRARRALKTPVGNPNIKTARKAAIESRQAAAEAFKAKVLPLIEEAKAAGRKSLDDIARYLNDRDIKTPRGTEWSRATVHRVLQ